MMIVGEKYDIEIIHTNDKQINNIIDRIYIQDKDNPLMYYHISYYILNFLPSNIYTFKINRNHLHEIYKIYNEIFVLKNSECYKMIRKYNNKNEKVFVVKEDNIYTKPKNSDNTIKFTLRLKVGLIEFE